MEFRARGGLFGGFNFGPSAAAETDPDVPQPHVVQRNQPPAALRPQSADFLIFSLGFTSVVCLVFITSDLMTMEPLSPVTVTIFVLASSYCGVLVRRQRTVNVTDRDMVIFEEAASATIRAEGGGSLDGGRQSRMMMLDKERRRQLLDYFVYRPPPMTLEDEEKQDRDSRVVGKAGGRYTWASHPDRYEREETIRNPNPNLNPNPNRIQSAPPSPRRSPPLKASHVSPDLIRRRGGDGGVQSQGGLVELREGSFGVNRAALGEERAVRPEIGGGGGDGGSAVSSDVVGDSEALNQSGISTVGALRTVPDAEGTDTAIPLRALSIGWSTSGACIICFGDYTYGEELCRLPCNHLYHARCIDAWFDGANHGWCPLCKVNVLEALRREAADVSSSTAAVSSAVSAAGGATAGSDGDIGASAGQNGFRSLSSGEFAV